MPTLAQFNGTQWVIPAASGVRPEIRFAPGTSTSNIDLFEGWLTNGVTPQHFARDALQEYARRGDSFTVQFVNTGNGSGFQASARGFYDISDKIAYNRRAIGIDGTISIDLLPLTGKPMRARLRPSCSKVAAAPVNRQSCSVFQELLGVSTPTFFRLKREGLAAQIGIHS